MDNDSVSNASSYKARGPLRNIINYKAVKSTEVVDYGRSAEILIEADSSDDEVAPDVVLESEDNKSMSSMDVASQSQASAAGS